MTRWMALDVGSRTIGVAVTDPLKITTRPLTTLYRKRLDSDARRILELIDHHQVEKLIVGKPLHLGGEPGEILRMIEPLVERLRGLAGVPVEWAEERLSTKEAEKLMASAGLSISERRKRRNEFAAAVILQWHLDERV